MATVCLRVNMQSVTVFSGSFRNLFLYLIILYTLPYYIIYKAKGDKQCGVSSMCCNIQGAHKELKMVCYGTKKIRFTSSFYLVIYKLKVHLLLSFYLIL